MDAAEKGHLAVVRALLIAGSRADLIDCEGKTALLLATQHGHQSVTTRPSWQRPNPASVPPQRAPCGSGQLGTPRARPGPWAPRHRLGGSSEPPPKSPIPPPPLIVRLASYQLLVRYFDANPKLQGMDDEADTCREIVSTV